MEILGSITTRIQQLAQSDLLVDDILHDSASEVNFLKKQLFHFVAYDTVLRLKGLINFIDNIFDKHVPTWCVVRYDSLSGTSTQIDDSHLEKDYLTHLKNELNYYKIQLSKMQSDMELMLLPLSQAVVLKQVEKETQAPFWPTNGGLRLVMEDEVKIIKKNIQIFVAALIQNGFISKKDPGNAINFFLGKQGHVIDWKKGKNLLRYLFILLSGENDLVTTIDFIRYHRKWSVVAAAFSVKGEMLSGEQIRTSNYGQDSQQSALLEDAVRILL